MGILLTSSYQAILDKKIEFADYPGNDGKAVATMEAKIKEPNVKIFLQRFYVNLYFHGRFTSSGSDQILVDGRKSLVGRDRTILRCQLPLGAAFFRVVSIYNQNKANGIFLDFNC
jgi:hypothetical protein